MALGRGASTTQVVTWHEAWGHHWITEYGLVGRVGWAVERLVARTRARHLSVSAATAADLASIGTCSAGVVEAGVDLAAIDAIAPRHQADVLYVGRLVPSKNVELLLASMAELATEGIERRLLIVGDGPHRAHLEQLVADLGLGSSVRFQGTLDRWEDVIALIKGSKVLALPSVREGFGLVALEAAACGTPVVTIDHPRNAAKDLVVDDHTGFVVAPDQFTAALRRILEDDDLETRMGIAARVGVGSGAWTDVAEATLAVYEGVPA
jgi:glycosyltransferase involved in cell wall biosynthesis